jgi:hypothetical protein
MKRPQVGSTKRNKKFTMNPKRELIVVESPIESPNSNISLM